MDECLDGPVGCDGPVFERLALSGSGMRFPRCEAHFQAHYERVAPRLEDVRRRYPVTAPADFDPSACGEFWSEEA